jgi:nitrite reductase/ring-hydroxylating ferredoxin subunit
MTQLKLCDVSEIGELEAKGFVGRVDGKQRNIFAVRKDGEYLVYLNCCPHAGALIDHIPGKFFNKDGSLLRCGMHGALFRIEDGECVDGLCAGDQLTRLPAEVKEGALYLTES